MLEHIVKNGEGINDILNMYHIDIEQLKGYNLHITDFYNLPSGIKIKIPLISNEIEQILENTESFVQKYYPAIDELNNVREIEGDEIIEATKPDISNDNKMEPINKGKPYPGIVPPNIKNKL